MTEFRPTFVDLCLQGEAQPSEIDDYIERWHGSDDDRTLSEFLGLTQGEYALWVKQPSALDLIISARKTVTR